MYSIMVSIDSTDGIYSKVAWVVCLGGMGRMVWVAWVVWVEWVAWIAWVLGRNNCRFSSYLFKIKIWA